MYLSHFRSIITVCVIHHLVFTGRSSSPVQHSPVDDIAINCGFSGSSFGSDGREWIGDMDSTFTSPKEVKGKSTISSTTVHQSLCADHVPYMTARISRSHFTYTSQLRPGQKFIRLHFCPASYPGFERSTALFTVKAGPYTLLSNFSPSLTADALGGVSYFAKEFCVNIEENQVFNITFSPSKSTCSSHPDDDVYAFINGIEIVSMPTGLYYTPDGDLGPPVVGYKFFRYYIPTGIVLVLSTLLYFIVYHLKYGPNHGRSWWWWLCGLTWQLWQLLSHRWRANYRIFSVAKIRALTNNFNDDHLINTENGGDVKVYEGYMEKIGKVVIKRYFTMPTGTDDFYNSLTELQCINVVSLVGYCLDYDGHEMILVHEYMANGTLFDHLHNTSHNNQCLSWKQRLQICIGAARGLSYLHTKKIIHGDVKLSNILLDQNWVAKMNFSFLVREKNTLVADDEKSDVYSFGIVLLQVLSGSRKAFTMENESERTPLSELVLKCIDEAESAEQIIDPFLKGNISHPCLRAFGEIANKCLLLNATQRPPMTEVVHKLELALQLQEIANKLVEPHNKEKEEHIYEVRQFLRDAGLESCNLIVGIDFTQSNETKGKRSFNQRCLHDINGDGLNPYEQSISIIGKALANFAHENLIPNLIPCFGFGDESTRDKNVFSFYRDERCCNGFEQVLSRYREIVPHLKLYGPTSFAPIIEMAMTIVKQSGFKYHVLLLITDGEVSPESMDETLKAIVEASKFPLSIILVGVGDGPWDMMRKFSDDIPERAFNNFHFVNFTEIMSKNLDESLKEAEFALTALMEIPSQNKATIGYSHPSGRKGNALGRVQLPHPLACDENPSS